MRVRPLAAIAAAAALLAAAPAALAHTDVAATSPRQGATVPVAPARVVVTYGDVLGSATTATVTVAGRDVAGPPRLDPRDARRLIVPLRSRPAGGYVVRWEVVGADGHALPGALSFTARADVSAAPLHRVGTALIATAATLRRAAA
ncbi:MAG: copper resistance protein CopC [Thermoleophilia bacterium]